MTINEMQPVYVKSCCANLYQSDWVEWLLGDSFHPGGVALTERLGQLLDLQPHHRVLDVASGQGTSAIFLAQQFGCEVVGLDYSPDLVEKANAAATAAAISHRVSFQAGDAEQLPFDAQSFDAVICECAFCTFPDKKTAVTEFCRVLKPGGKIGMSDLTRTGTLPPEMDGLLAWIACIADAQPVDIYVDYLIQAGLTVTDIEKHDAALQELVHTVRGKLIAADMLLKLNKLDLPELDLTQAKTLARHAETAVRAGKLGYVLITASDGRLTIFD